MNTEQIIKALECCTSESTEFDCTTCPYMYKGCNINVMRDALALIKDQQLNFDLQSILVKQLTEDLKQAEDDARKWHKEVEKLQAHNENLKKENKYLRERLAEEAEIKEDMKGK